MKTSKRHSGGHERLQKVLAAAGVDSRRRCEELILEGAVRVNKRIVDQLPAFVDPATDVITVHGRRIHNVAREYHLLNKPKGVLCTNYDPQGRRLAVDLVPTKQRVFCAGRLEAETTGLMIVTNDSELTNRLTHPRYGLSKRYVATVDGLVDNEIIEKLTKGIWLAEGKAVAGGIKVLRRGHTESTIEVTIKQGLNRQVRRMLAAVGLEVTSLKLARIGRIDSRGLGVGHCRPLTPKEVAYLKKATSGQEAKDEEAPLG